MIEAEKTTVVRPIGLEIYWESSTSQASDLLSPEKISYMHLKVQILLTDTTLCLGSHCVVRAEICKHSHFW